MTRWGDGRAFAEPHLRAAAADWARRRLETEGIAQLWATGWRRVVLVVWPVVFVGELLWRLSTGSVGRAFTGLLVGLGIIAVSWLALWNRRRLLRATISRNEGPPTGGDHLR